MRNAKPCSAPASIGSPHILELSGIGRARCCANAGVDVVKEVKGVGENLQDHLQLRLAYKVTGVPTLNEKATKPDRQGGDRARISRSPLRADGDGAEPARHLHPIGSGPGNAGSAISRAAGVAGEVRRSRPSFPGNHRERLQSEAESRGSVHLSSPDFAAQPTISPKYLITMLPAGKHVVSVWAEVIPARREPRAR
jgi:choline dehydrogenase-like flavoprotein